MTKHKVSPYRVRLRQHHKNGQKVRTQDLWPLDDLSSVNPGFREFDNFIELLEDFLQNLKEDGYLNKDVKRTLAAVDFETGDGDFDSDPEARTLEAELNYGRYNRVADHNNKDVFSDSTKSPDGSRKESERDRDTVAETRLHLLVHIPTNTDKNCFFVLHSYGQNSVKTRLKDALVRFIGNKYDSNSTPFAMKSDRRKSSFKLEMNTVAGADLVDELKKSTIVGFEVHKRDTNVPEYMSESTALGNDSEGDLTIQYTSDNIMSDISTKKETFWENIRNEEYPFAELVDNDPSRANAIVEVNEHDTRRINIGKDEIRMERTLDPTELEYDSEGRVLTYKIGELSREHINEKLNEIGATTLSQQSLLQ